MKKDNILYVAEDCSEVYHRNGRHLLYVYPNGFMVHISKVKEQFGIVNIDLVNQCSTRDFLEWNLLLMPKNIKLAIFEYEIDHDNKVVKNTFTLNSNSSDLLELIKENFENGTYKDYKEENNFIVSENDFDLSEEGILEIINGFDNENYIKNALEKVSVDSFPTNIEELLNTDFVLPKTETKIPEVDFEKDVIPF